MLSNLTRQEGLCRRVIAAMQLHGLTIAKTEVRTCGWLAQVDEHGGSIFAWRPFSKGAADMAALLDEVLERLGILPSVEETAEPVINPPPPVAPDPLSTNHNSHDKTPRG